MSNSKDHILMRIDLSMKVAASCLFSLLLLAATPTVGQNVIYVDDDSDSTGNGSSWENAFVHLQDALSVAEAGDEIGVAEGISFPDLGANVTEGDREESFYLKSGCRDLRRLCGG